jgi:hypothetical protein
LLLDLNLPEERDLAPEFVKSQLHQVPLVIAISLSHPGLHTLDAPIYTLEVKFDGEISDADARCLLGANDPELHPDLDCRAIAPVFGFIWELRQDGQIVGRGTSARVGTVLKSNDGTEAMVVGFPARTKHQYEIALTFNQDAPNAKTTPPRVRVKVDSFVREDRLIVGAILDWVALAACLAGVIILSVQFFRQRFRRSGPID